MFVEKLAESRKVGVISLHCGYFIVIILLTLWYDVRGRFIFTKHGMTGNLKKIYQNWNVNANCSNSYPN